MRFKKNQRGQTYCRGQDGGAQQEVTEPTKVHIKAPALLTQSEASLKEDGGGLISLEEDL